MFALVVFMLAGVPTPHVWTVRFFLFLFFFLLCPVGPGGHGTLERHTGGWYLSETQGSESAPSGKMTNRREKVGDWYRLFMVRSVPLLLFPEHC